MPLQLLNDGVVGSNPFKTLTAAPFLDTNEHVGAHLIE